MELERRSSGVAKAGLATGITGAALGGLNSLTLLGMGARALGGFGRNGQPVVVTDNGGYPVGGRCSEDHYVNRYELELQQKLAEKDSQIALRDANTYNDQKNLEMYAYFDVQLKDVRKSLCDQAVHNQRTEDSFVLARQDIASVKDELHREIEMEAERRCCGDNSIVTYANATFYPKQVADVTTGTATTAQTLYNPLPKCGCCKN